MPEDTHLDREHTRGWVNTGSFGAGGDGMSDETRRLQRAHDELPDSGGRIIVPPGVHRFQTWSITKPVEIVGSGKTGQSDPSLRAPTVLSKFGALDGIVIDSPRGASLSDLQVDGEAGNAGDGVVLLNGVGSSVRNVTVSNQGGVGLRIGQKNAAPGNVNNWHVERLIAAGNGSHGMYVHALDAPGGPNANGGVLINLDARSNGGDGLRVDTAILNTFLGIVAQSNTGWGVNIAPAAALSLWSTFVIADSEGNVAGQSRLTANAQRCVVVDHTTAAPIANAGFLNAILRPGVVSGQVNPLTDGGLAQTGQVYQGSGVPAGGANGDIYFRTDTPATVNQRLYIKSAGVWQGIL